MPARVTLRGRGPDRTRIVVAAGESRPALMVAGDDVTIEGVTLERLAGSGAALVAVTAERAALRNNVFISSASGLPLVNATAGSGHRVESNRFESVMETVGCCWRVGPGIGWRRTAFVPRGRRSCCKAVPARWRTMISAILAERQRLWCDSKA